MTEIFTKEEFETQGLPVNKKTGELLWEEKGLVAGEYAYTVRTDPQVVVQIRSSVKANGVCANTGKDSIRAWLTDNNDKPIAGKVSAFTTRRPGWGDRTKDVIRTLWTWRSKAGNCDCCGNPRSIRKVKKEGPNKGRLFATCNTEECGNQFRWVTEQD